MRTRNHYIMFLAALVAALALIPASGALAEPTVEAAPDGYVPGRIRTTVLSEEVVQELEPVTLPNGEAFTPKVKYITVSVDLDDLRAERDRAVREAAQAAFGNNSAAMNPGPVEVLEAAAAPYDRALAELSLSGNCGFMIVQRFLNASFGRATQSSICTESDPMSLMFMTYNGFIDQFYGQNGYGSDYCGPNTNQDHYLWMDDQSHYGFYTEDWGHHDGSCLNRVHVRLWHMYDTSSGLLFSVGSPHKEYGIPHEVVTNGWHLGRDSVKSDWDNWGQPSYYYSWGNAGYWGNGGYFNGYAAELVGPQP